MSEVRCVSKVSFKVLIDLCRPIAPLPLFSFIFDKEAFGFSGNPLRWEMDLTTACSAFRYMH